MRSIAKHVFVVVTFDSYSLFLYAFYLKCPLLQKKWGLLITFIELIKNQRYQFWNHPFTRCATEIERIFESVARSCLTPASQRAVSAGGDPQ